MQSNNFMKKIISFVGTPELTKETTTRRAPFRDAGRLELNQATRFG